MARVTLGQTRRAEPGEMRSVTTALGSPRVPSDVDLDEQTAGGGSREFSPYAELAFTLGELDATGAAGLVVLCKSFVSADANGRVLLVELAKRLGHPVHR